MKAWKVWERGSGGDENEEVRFEPKKLKAAVKAKERRDAHKERNSLRTRASLIERLKNLNDQESWNRFFETYRDLLYVTAQRAGLMGAEAEDAVQETVISVCKAIPDFHYDPQRGSFRGWLIKITYWRIKDQFRKRLRAHEAMEVLQEEACVESGSGDDATPALDVAEVCVPADLEEIWDAEWQATLLTTALARVKRQIAPKNYQLFDANVIREWPMEKMKRVLNASAPRIYLAKQRVTAAIRRELRSLQGRYI